MIKKTRKRRGNSRYYLFFFVSLLAVTSLGFAAWYTLTHVNLFALTKITLTGNTVVPDSLIQKSVTPYLGMNLLAIPSRDVKSRLMKFSRIRDVKIHKKLLHTIHLEIAERKGVVYLKSYEGDLFPVDSEGIVLARYSRCYKEDIPIFTTYLQGTQIKPGRKLKNAGLSKILALHQRITKEAPDFLPHISEYYLIDNTVNIIDSRYGTRIIPSDEDMASQLKRYIFVQDNGNIDRRSVVDLRFKNQVVVKAGDK